MKDRKTKRRKPEERDIHGYRKTREMQMGRPSWRDMGKPTKRLRGCPTERQVIEKGDNKGEVNYAYY